MQLYEKFKFPFVLLYGGFPAKLTTFIGDPIHVDPGDNIEAEELNDKVQSAVRAIVDQVQPKPGKILRAISERFLKPDLPSILS